MKNLFREKVEVRMSPIEIFRPNGRLLANTLVDPMKSIFEYLNGHYYSFIRRYDEAYKPKNVDSVWWFLSDEYRKENKK